MVVVNRNVVIKHSAPFFFKFRLYPFHTCIRVQISNDKATIIFIIIIQKYNCVIITITNKKNIHCYHSLDSIKKDINYNGNSVTSNAFLPDNENIIYIITM